MPTTRRDFMGLVVALGLGVSLLPRTVSAKPPAKPPARPQPRPKPQKPQNVKPTPKVKQMAGRDMNRGARLANPSVKRPEAKSHPYRHAPMSRRVLRDKARARLAARQKSGQKTPNGVTYSTFKDRKTINHSIGYAHKHYQGPIKKLANGQKLEVSVPYGKSIGTVYNTKTSKYRSGTDSKVVFRKDRQGIFVETVFVQ